MPDIGDRLVFDDLQIGVLYKTPAGSLWIVTDVGENYASVLNLYTESGMGVLSPAELYRYAFNGLPRYLTSWRYVDL